MLPRMSSPDEVTANLPGWFRRHLAWFVGGAVVLVVLGVLAAVALPRILTNRTKADLYDGRLVDADYWTADPRILSAGLGFEGTIGTAVEDEANTLDAGGAWDTSLVCAQEPTDAQRSNVVPGSTLDMTVLAVPGAKLEKVDGLPVVFSWPLRTNTIDPTQFLFTLNTGEQVGVDSVTMTPNFELNERNTVVMFSDLGNRASASEPDARFPVRLDIVPASDGRELMLAGPQGDVPATGLSWTGDGSPYDVGPTLVGAKLNRVGDAAAGEGGVPSLTGGTLPNDEFALYGSEGQYRLRMLTSGGFSPDSIRGVLPTDFETFFRLHATGADGSDVVLDRVGQEYDVAGGTLRIVGLSELGKPEGDGIVYDDCYTEDRDNYIDIIISGPEAAARSVTGLEIPALEGGYAAFYNPGGPGGTPTPGVRYTAPGPASLTPVVIALDDPMRVSRD